MLCESGARPGLRRAAVEGPCQLPGRGRLRHRDRRHRGRDRAVSSGKPPAAATSTPTRPSNGAQAVSPANPRTGLSHRGLSGTGASRRSAPSAPNAAPAPVSKDRSSSDQAGEATAQLQPLPRRHRSRLTATAITCRAPQSSGRAGGGTKAGLDRRRSSDPVAGPQRDSRPYPPRPAVQRVHSAAPRPRAETAPAGTTRHVEAWPTAHLP